MASKAMLALALLALCLEQAAGDAPAATAGRRRRGTSGGVTRAALDAFNPAKRGASGGAGSASAGANRARPPPPLRPSPPPPRPLLAGSPSRFNASDYKTVLARSFLFYEAQRSGQLPASNRVPWRRSAHLTDRIPGGYYDAGDYIKHSLTIAQTSLFLAWAALDFGAGVVAAGEAENARAAVQWATDYLLKCSEAPEGFVGLISDPDLDHEFWGRPEEQYLEQPKPRKVYAWTRSMPASDLLGMTSAAMTSASLLFRGSNSSYADRLLRKAQELYLQGATVKGKYNKSFPKYPRDIYESNRYNDKLFLAAAWLGRATGNDTYFSQAQQWWRASMNDREDGGYVVFVSWDSVAATAAVLLTGQAGVLGAARVPAVAEYTTFLDQVFLNSWTLADGTDRSYGVAKTPMGLRRPVWSKWGNTRYACNAAFVALLRAVQLPAGSQTRAAYVAFARSQLDYVLGSSGRSYVVGWGVNPPLHVAHAGASCPDRPKPCDWDYFEKKAPNPQVLHGALVAGPAGPGDNTYKDKRDDYVTNEVTLDYNSGMTGALAGMVQLLVAGEAPRSTGQRS